MTTSRVIIRKGTADQMTEVFDGAVDTEDRAIYDTSPLDAALHRDDRSFVELLEQTVQGTCDEIGNYVPSRAVEVEVHTEDHGTLVLRLTHVDLQRVTSKIYRAETRWDVTRGEDNIGQLSGSTFRLVPRAPGYYGKGDSLVAAAADLSARAWEPARAERRLAELGGQRAVLRAQLEGVEGEMRERARQAYHSGTGAAESKLARDAGVDRMTMRKWLGKR
jgi:hypothetical protein